MLKQRIRTQLAHRLGVPEIPFAMQRLALAGFSPRQIFDVGAYKGDFARTCLEVWPSAKIACFEALASRLAQLEQLATTKRAIQVFPGLLGAESKDNVPLHEAETASSVCKDSGFFKRINGAITLASSNEFIQCPALPIESTAIASDARGSD